MMSANAKQISEKYVDFEKWLESVSDVFKTLTSEQQTTTFKTLLQKSTSEQRYHLLKDVSRALRRDILASLPTELQEHICHYIDLKSLFTACCVSRHWNGIISSLSEVWHRKCSLLGTGPVKHEVVSWKGQCLKSLRLIEGIHSGAAFQNCDITASYITLEQITGLDYCKGFLIGSAEDQVGVWRTEDYRLISLFPVPYRISCLQVSNGKLLAIGHSTGYITTWTLEITKEQCFSNPHQEYRSHTGVVMSLSVCTELDVMVSGATDFRAKIWCISSGSLLKTLLSHSHWVVQVTLLPSLEGKPSKTLFKGKHSLLTMTRDHVRVFSWNVDKDKNVYGDLETVDDSLIVFPLKSVQQFFTPGCHVTSGKVVYVQQTMVKTEAEGNAEIVFQSLSTNTCVGRVCLALKVRKLLAVGDKFALLLLPHCHSIFNLLVVELATGKIIGGCHLPHSSSSTPDLAQIVVGEKSWLNGLAQQKPDDLVIALGLPNGQIRVVTWRDLQETSTG